MAMSEKSCVPCQGGLPPMPREEAQKLMTQVPDWVLNELGTALSRKFIFKSFGEALQFANRVGELSEKEGHHPQLTIGWGYCTVLFTTNKIKGLHENDFIMAAKTSALTGTPSVPKEPSKA